MGGRLGALCDGCRIGWMAIGCGAGDQLARDLRLASEVLGGSRAGTGLGSGEELVHDLGAGGDDGS